MQMYRYDMSDLVYMPIGNMPLSYNSTQFLYETYNSELNCANYANAQIGTLKTQNDLVIPPDQTLNNQICMNRKLADTLATTYTLHSGADERYLNTKTEYNIKILFIVTITLGIAQSIFLSRFI